jgi:hypothetical protein
MQPEISLSQVSIFLKSYLEKCFSSKKKFLTKRYAMAGAIAGRNILSIS